MINSIFSHRNQISLYRLGGSIEKVMLESIIERWTNKINFKVYLHCLDDYSQKSELIFYHNILHTDQVS